MSPVFVVDEFPSLRKQKRLVVRLKRCRLVGEFSDLPPSEDRHGLEEIIESPGTHPPEATQELESNIECPGPHPPEDEQGYEETMKCTDECQAEASRRLQTTQMAQGTQDGTQDDYGTSTKRARLDAIVGRLQRRLEDSALRMKNGHVSQGDRGDLDGWIECYPNDAIDQQTGLEESDINSFQNNNLLDSQAAGQPQHGALSETEESGDLGRLESQNNGQQESHNFHQLETRGDDRQVSHIRDSWASEENATKRELKNHSPPSEIQINASREPLEYHMQETQVDQQCIHPPKLGMDEEPHKLGIRGSGDDCPMKKPVVCPRDAGIGQIRGHADPVQRWYKKKHTANKSINLLAASAQLRESTTGVINRTQDFTQQKHSLHERNMTLTMADSSIFTDVRHRSNVVNINEPHSDQMMVYPQPSHGGTARIDPRVMQPGQLFTVQNSQGNTSIQPVRVMNQIDRNIAMGQTHTMQPITGWVPSFYNHPHMVAAISNPTYATNVLIPQQYSYSATVMMPCTAARAYQYYVQKMPKVDKQLNLMFQ